MIGARTPRPDFVAVPESPAPTPLPFTPSPPRAFPRKQLAAAVVVVLLVATVAWFLVSSPPPSDPVADLAVAGFAEDYIFAYLSAAGEGSESSLAPYLGYTPTLTGMQAGSFYVTNVSIRDLSMSDDEWNVVASVHLLALTDGGYTPTAPLQFAVHVVQVPGGGLRAQALPAPIHLPDTGSTIGHDEGDQLPVGDSADQVAGYLDWYLTQTTPIAGMAPIGGFTQATLMSLSVDGNVALAGVLATTPAGHAFRLDIPLVNEEGTWRAAELSSASE